MKKSKEIKKAYKDDKIGAIVYSIDANSISPNPSQPRKAFDINSITKLANSIRRFGLLQPISVREISEPSARNSTQRYELIAGERRLRACKMLGMAQIPCIIINSTPDTSAELALVENLVREDLNIFEEARAFSALSSQYCMTQEEIAAKMSISQSAVANKLRLLRLTHEEQETVLKANLTERHARALLRITTPELRKEALEHIILNKLNVSQTEEYISALMREPKHPSAERPSPTYTHDKICKDIYKFIARIQKASKNLVINRKSDDKYVTITLTVKKDAL